MGMGFWSEWSGGLSGLRRGGWSDWSTGLTGLMVYWSTGLTGLIGLIGLTGLLVYWSGWSPPDGTDEVGNFAILIVRYSNHWRGSCSFHF